jgi:simple sugar transport system permease protein
MNKKNQEKMMDPRINFLINNSVPILIIILLAFAIPLSGFTGVYLIREIINRISRNSFLVLSLLIPVMAGMGLNFGIVLGAIAGEIGLIFITDWNIEGISGVLLAILISTPLAILLGYFSGVVLNRAKGREMVTGFMLSFFMNGVYQLVVLYAMGKYIPISNNFILLPQGFGIRNSISLVHVRQSLDKLIPLKIGSLFIPLATFIVIAIFCLFIIWFRTTKIGQEIRTVGQDINVAKLVGIDVGKIRILSIVISTVLACYGQIIFLQNMGTMNTYYSHEQVGIFAIATLLVGGASVDRANIYNVFLGIILFHTMFVVMPRAGKELIGQAQLGEHFRVFISYAVIAISLALYAWKKQVRKENERKKTMFLKKRPSLESL